MFTKLIKTLKLPVFLDETNFFKTFLNPRFIWKFKVLKNISKNFKNATQKYSLRETSCTENERNDTMDPLKDFQWPIFWF